MQHFITLWPGSETSSTVSMWPNRSTGRFFVIILTAKQKQENLHHMYQIKIVNMMKKVNYTEDVF